ncbi:SRPBCC family protein [Streptomyces filamentosus]|uniref:SRPBCC family protein n=1 Tax=Streptomyces filamentosus TaxID=67294 RepID=UPI00381650F8
MAETKGAPRRTKGRSGGGSKAQKMLDRNPGAHRLAEEFESYLQARLEKVLTGVGHRVGDVAERVAEGRVGPGTVLHGAKRAVLDKVVPGGGSDDSGESDESNESDGSSGEPRSSASNAGGKSLTIVEDVDVGVPVEEAYDQWTQFQEFGRFAKGVVSVDQEDDTTTHWRVKVARSSRAWTGTITEQIPDERIAWSSEGAKGTTRGVVTFHPLGENLTKVLLVMEYHPKGLVEKTGALVRAQGRRARLDLKAFRTFVMMRGEASGGWRGEIRDGEVVAGPEEDGEDEEYEDEEYEDENEDQGAYEDEEEDREQEEDRDRDREEPEDAYEDDEEADDEEADDEEADDEPRTRRSRGR